MLDIKHLVGIRRAVRLKSASCKSFRFFRDYSQKPTNDSLTNSNQAVVNRQQLYITNPLTPGSVFFLPHGTRILNKLISFMKHQQMKYGFEEVVTPLIYKNKLWEISGHWDNYKDDMFKVVGNDLNKEENMNQEEEDPVMAGDTKEHEYGLKPMNCPGHCVIFSKFERSYQELPVRFSDFSSLHRNEASGALSGLTRVRRFHQDDGHIFCQLSQIDTEIDKTISMAKNVYKIFGIDEGHLEFFLSTRPEDKYVGDIETWDSAEAQLQKVLERTIGPKKWLFREGDGAFYGPKIDILIKDAFEKKHQVGTIQLDFQLPARFELSYVSPDGSRDKRPILIHRAIFGSLERFLAILLDHYKGKWPFWINPRQAVIIPVNESHHGPAEDIQAHLKGDITDQSTDVSPLTGYNFYVDVDGRPETVGNRIKDAIQKGYSFILMIGDKELESGKIAVRSRDNRKISYLSSKELYSTFVELERKYQ